MMDLGDPRTLGRAYALLLLVYAVMTVAPSPAIAGRKIPKGTLIHLDDGDVGVILSLSWQG